MYCGVPIVEPGRVNERSRPARPSPDDPVGRLDRPASASSLAIAPVDDQCLAEPAEHDVLGLEVAVHDAAAMCIGNRVAGVDETAQEPAENQLPLARPCAPSSPAVEPLDRLFECFSLDQPHRIIRPAVGMPAQAVNRHDPRVLQPPGDPGLPQKPRLADRSSA